MVQPLQIAGLTVSALACVGAAYLVFAAARTRALFGREGARDSAKPTEGPFRAPTITVFKPLHRDEPGLEAALASVFDQDYPGAAQVIFGLQDAADPALATARRLAAAHPDRDVAVVLDARLHGTNRKVSNLINMAREARGEVWVLADSDITVPPDHLRRVAAALAEPGVGVVTCAYYGAAETGLWSRLAAMDLSYRFLPSVAVGVSLGLAQPCMGSTIALRRETLAAVGGFAAFADLLADDYAIGAAVRKAGLRSRVAPVLVAHGCTETSFGELWTHELRWAKTVRGVDPAGFAGSIVTHPLAFALTGVALTKAAPWALAALAFVLICRVWMIREVEKVTRPVGGAWWLFPARDILSLIVFVSSFFVRVVRWRGTRFRVDARGGLSGV